MARKQGIKFLRIGDVEFELGAEPEALQTLPEAKEVQDVPAYSDEALLLWSTQGNFPDPVDS